MPRRTLVIALVALLALAACGRRGDLEPPGATTKAAPAAVATPAPPGGGISPLDPGSTGNAEAVTAPPPKDAPKRFFLDFLL
jgi:predicted small lipoprotein YifL